MPKTFISAVILVMSESIQSFSQSADSTKHALKFNQVIFSILTNMDISTFWLSLGASILKGIECLVLLNLKAFLNLLLN